jgi:hypothetical protein
VLIKLTDSQDFRDNKIVLRQGILWKKDQSHELIVEDLLARLTQLDYARSKAMSADFVTLDSK